MPFCKRMGFESLDEHHTRMHLHFCYEPPGGELGHAIASMLGCDAQSVLSDLLMRAKFFLETGREPHDAVARGHRGRVKQGDKADLPGPPLRGPGAPTEDVVRFMDLPAAQRTWPSDPLTVPAGAGGPHFPPSE
jgi:hypothetical protein